MKMAISDLVAEYAGGPAWAEFARANGSRDESISSVAKAVLGAQATTWLETAVPALDNQRPNDLLDGDDENKNAVRALIMRLP